MNALELSNISPNLKDCLNLALGKPREESFIFHAHLLTTHLFSAKKQNAGVPGTYSVSGDAVRIVMFRPNVQVIKSKQRPRKIVVQGEDGKHYAFLLKGHEDLRQDERAMQVSIVTSLLFICLFPNKYAM